ncbi:MAG: MobA/MobL family protein [Acidaminococcales bacterium]|jgi:hypothetical protein|nr:MobA/MobL family protein [Acidaminococcales bacterium]
MAIYHCSIRIVSRGKGNSAVASAAYRSGTRITNEYDGETHDFTRKRGIAYTEIILPGHAPREFENRGVLWNSVEKIEKQKNSQLAREIEIALPAELTQEQNISLVRRFVKEQFADNGMCADVAVHDKGDGNPHAHIMLTMRPLNPDGTWGAKVVKVNGRKTYPVDWDKRDNAELWRRAWAAYCNTALRINGHDDVVDHRSYERQGVEQIPTVHLGPVASGLEKRGVKTELGDRNREIAAMNSKLRQINARLKKLEAYKFELLQSPPTLYEVFSELCNQPPEKRGQSRKIADIKNMADMLLFFDKYGIETVADLTRVVREIRGNFDDVRDDLKKNERRLKTLDEHIKHSENFKSYRGYKAKYDKLYAEYRTLKKSSGLFAERKARKALEAANDYCEDNRMELTLFDAAEKYLKGVLQSRYDPKKLPPITAWKDEREKKTTERAALYQRYEKLKTETQNIEAIKRTIDQIIKTDEPEIERPKSQSRGYDYGR